MEETEKSFHQFPAALVNITNKCTLHCKHCFVFRDENPNSQKGEMDTPTMLKKLAERQRRHGI